MLLFIVILVIYIHYIYICVCVCVCVSLTFLMPLLNFTDRHDKYVEVPVDKASNNIVFICQTHYINCLREELGLNTSEGHPIYPCDSLPKQEILRNIGRFCFPLEFPHRKIWIFLSYIATLSRTTIYCWFG